MKKHLSAVTTLALLVVLGSPIVVADDNADFFNRLDADGDGYLTMEEAEKDSKLGDAFSDGDDNDDGRLDMAEFAKLEIGDD